MKHSTSDDIKVSVVIPAYNAENWIKRCMDSVIHQTYQNLEIIVINDGSTDSTLEILKDYRKKDYRIIIIDKKNAGTFHSRIEGINRSTGDAIFNADADDFLEPDGIKLMVARMIESNTDIVIGNHFHSINGNKIIVENKLPIIQNKVNLLKSLLNNEIKGYIWGKLYKRNLLLGINYNISDLLQEDVLINLHILVFNKISIAIENNPVYNYVIHSNSANSSKNKNLIENVYRFIEITENILVESNQLNEIEDELKLFKCRNWIVYSRMGGELTKNKAFRTHFYLQNYTSYSKSKLSLYHKVEMFSYNYNPKFGLFITTVFKKINNVIYKLYGK